MTDRETPLGIGLIGCGWIAELAHLPSLRALPGVELRAYADPAEARRAVAHAAFPDARAYASGEALLADAAVEAVVLGLPPTLNRGAAEAAFAAGRHVFIEKPLAADTADGAAIVAAWRASGRSSMVGYNFRYSPMIEAARHVIASGRLGALIGLQGVFTWTGPEDVGWRGEPATGGGVMLDMASHHIDLVAYLSGAPVRRVSAHARALRRAEDTVDLTLETVNGPTAQLHVCSSAGVNANRLELLGSRGQLRVDLLDGRPRQPVDGSPRLARVRRAGRALAELHPARLLRSPGHEPSFARALGAFVAACREGRPAAPDPAEALAVLRVAEVARRSAASGGKPLTVAFEAAPVVAAR